jgi:adenosylhomocysteine nucleosidase
MSAASERVPTLAIVTALPEEFRPIRARQRFRRTESISGREVSIGRIGAWSCALIAGGEGLFNAREGARCLLRFFDPVALIGAGVAGGISPGLESGEILAGSRVVGPGPAAYPSDPRWLERACRAGAREGLIVTGDTLLVSADSKVSLWKSVGSADPAVVDLESSGWAEVADRARVPFLALRAVADRAGDELPPLLSTSRHSSGATDRKRVVLRAIRHPGSIAGLLRLARRTNLASLRLAETLERLLSEIAP